MDTVMDTVWISIIVYHMDTVCGVSDRVAYTVFVG